MPMQVPVVEVVAGLLRRPDGSMLLAERPEGRHYRGCWELPGGKCDPGETLIQALQRELHEELDIRVRQARPLITVQHGDNRLHIVLNVFCVDEYLGEPRGAEGQQVCWRQPHEVERSSLTPADQFAFPAILLPDQYVISPPARDARWERCFRAVLNASDALMQLRAHDLCEADYAGLAERILHVCDREHRRRILLNSSLELSARMGQGCHLPFWRLAELDADRIAQWRRQVGHGVWLAASCHNRSELRQAESLGVDFAVLSPVNPTRTHPQALPLGISRLQELVRTTNLPVYGLGGMRPEDTPNLWQAGAQGVAGISAFWPD